VTTFPATASGRSTGSHKYGKLIVKDPSLPITRSAAVFWERTEENPTVDRTDAEAEIVVSVCRNLLSQSVQFTVGWNEGDTGRCVFQQIRDIIAIIIRKHLRIPLTGL
jgi:hypothetical protein